LDTTYPGDVAGRFGEVERVVGLEDTKCVYNTPVCLLILLLLLLCAYEKVEGGGRKGWHVTETGKYQELKNKKNDPRT